jgi:hypothetical protein
MRCGRNNIYNTSQYFFAAIGMTRKNKSPFAKGNPSSTRRKKGNKMRQLDSKITGVYNNSQTK